MSAKNLTADIDITKTVNRVIFEIFRKIPKDRFALLPDKEFILPIDKLTELGEEENRTTK